MSPSEVTSQQPTANALLQLYTAGNIRKPSTRASFSKARRLSDVLSINSPLTPWEDELILNTKRKSPLKLSTRQLKSLKNNSKEAKKKDKKVNGKNVAFPVKFSNCGEGNERQLSTNFRYYSDIGQYMREYRLFRNLVAAEHKDCSCHGAYGKEEINKAYEALGIPRILQRNRLLTSSRKTTLPPVEDVPIINQESPELEESDSESTESSSIDGREDEITSPDARERRNNLNLSPLRKQVRLPDTANYPVQFVSGFGVQELARLAASRSDLRQNKDNEGATTPKLQYSISSDKKFFSTPLHLQEKKLCRVVELSLPEACHADDDNEDKANKVDNPFPSHRKSLRHESRTDKEFSKIKLQDVKPGSDLRKEDLNEAQDDPLTLAISSSRSCQSSVLSTAVTSISNSPCSIASIRNKTVKEMLTAAVRDLHPFGKNGEARSRLKDRVARMEDANERLRKLSQDTSNSEAKEKQTVSLRTYRNLSYKPSMRKFMEELYTPERDYSLEKQATCQVAGKQLKKLTPLPNSSISSLESTKYSRLAEKLKKTSSNSPYDASTVLKPVRYRSNAEENYEPLRRVVTLDTQRIAKPAKLAIFSKCHTVVKPQVSVRGIAL